MLSLLNVKRDSIAQLDNTSQDQKHTDVQKAITALLVHTKKPHAQQEPTCHTNTEHSATTVHEVTTVWRERRLLQFAQLADTARLQLVLNLVYNAG